MSEARAIAEELVPAGEGSATARETIVAAVAADLRTAAADAPALRFVLHYVDVACPSGAHPRSIMTFRSLKVAALFCLPCEQGWTVPNTDPGLRTLPPPCPDCDSHRTPCTLTTASGFYCRCGACGNVWHHEQPAPAV